TLDETVRREVSAATLQQYGGRQEPELTILKAVGQFAVARWRGAATLASFSGVSTPPAGMAVREVDPAYSRIAFQQYMNQSIQGDHNTTLQAGRDATNIAGDQIATGDIQGTGIAIGRGARSEVRTINTGGGDHAEGNIDKRQGTFIGGDQFNMSGNFSNANVTIGSAAPAAAHDAHAELRHLLGRFTHLMQQAPPELAGEAAAAEQFARQTVEAALAAQPNRVLLRLNAGGLRQAAQALPNAAGLAEQIATAALKLIGET
ncbi:MAG TPA: hypothetical protein PKA05_23030, partial [Roseiflexaceae bacterium]|nr:hypothetical protein [Roseiflexaceae bacterium]